MKMVELNEFYDLYEDGSLYSKITNKFVVPDTSNRSGYVRVTMYKPSRTRHLLHRLVAEHFLEKKGGDMVVNHKDGNKKNNHYMNLEWVSRSENEKHAYRSGLRPNASRACRYKDKIFTNVVKLSEFLQIDYNMAYNRCLSKNSPDYELL